MRQKLLRILIQLKESNSWDLAEELAFGVYKTPHLKESYISSLISFLHTASKNAKDKSKINNLLEAKNKLIAIKKQEEKERNHHFQELELQLKNI